MVERTVCEAVSYLNMIKDLSVSAAKLILMFQYDFFKGLINMGESLWFINEISWCLNRDHDVLTITRAALTDSDQRKMSDVFDQ